MQNVSDVPSGGYTRRRSSEPYELKVFCRRFVQGGRAVGFSQIPESTQSSSNPVTVNLALVLSQQDLVGSRSYRSVEWLSLVSRVS